LHKYEERAQGIASPLQAALFYYVNIKDPLVCCRRLMPAVAGCLIVRGVMRATQFATSWCFGCQILQ
jgi:hypothetical protein